MATVADEKEHGLSAVWLLLGQERLKRKYRTRLEAHDFLMEHGLPFKAMTALSGAMRIDLTKEGAAVFGLEPRTIARRKRANRLEKGEAAMLFRIAEVVDKAVDAFDDKDRAMRWLQKPCRALNNKAPLHLMRDDIGRSLVEEVLGQIKFGLYS